MKKITLPARCVAAALLTCAWLSGVLPGTAQASVTLCFNDGTDPIARAFVTHHIAEGVETDTMTGADGCVTLHTAPGPTADVTLHAHNPVVRMSDPLLMPRPSMRMTISDGATIVVAGPLRAYFRLANQLRRAYNLGLGNFSPWGGTEFPYSQQRTEGNWIEAHFPDRTPAVLAFVEPQGAFTGFPIVHFQNNTDPVLIGLAAELGIALVPNTDAVVAHELGHALHFAELPIATRDRATGKYLDWLEQGNFTHQFAMVTTPFVAYIEAFGLFAQLYFETATEIADPDREQGVSLPPVMNPEWFFSREQAYYDLAAEERQFGEVRGGDVEGAVFKALFFDYAQSPGIGLEFVVETVVGCDGLTVYEYADCIADEFGLVSAEYFALLEACRDNGILIGSEPWTAFEQDGDEFGQAIARGDFNGDGFDDVAIGAPGDRVIPGRASGAVYVFHGSRMGLWPARRLTQAPAGGADEAGDEFGAALVAADLDGDGFDDLVVGAPGEQVGSIAAGYVFAFRGARGGLDEWTRFSQRGIGRAADENGDRFGAALAAGDFDGDGVPELVIGSPGEAPFADPRAGYVHVVRLASGRPVLYRQFGQENLDQRDAGDLFGLVLATGDVDADGIVDLVVGAPGNVDYGQVYTVGGRDKPPIGFNPEPGVRSGAVFVFRGPELSPWLRVSQRTFGATENAGDEFGAALSATLGAGGRGLLIGAPGRAGDAGRVYAMNADNGLLQPLASFGVADLGHPALAGDRFGTSLQTDGFDAGVSTFVGAPGRTTSTDSTGMVFELNLDNTGRIIRRGSYRSPKPPGAAGEDARFGTTVVVIASDELSENNQLLIGAPGAATPARFETDDGALTTLDSAGGAGFVFTRVEDDREFLYQVEQRCEADCTWR